MPSSVTRVGDPAKQTDVELTDLDGITRHPLDAAGRRGAIVIFIANECPISNSYAPEIERIAQQFGAPGTGGFAVSVVYPEADLSEAEARSHVKDFGYTCPVYVDTHRKLAVRLDARVMPEAFVVDPMGKTLYRGRIDDKFVDYGRSRPEPTVRDLRNAIEAVRAGKPVPVSRTESIGCPIEG